MLPAIFFSCTEFTTKKRGGFELALDFLVSAGLLLMLSIMKKKGKVVRHMNV
jgi:hypothetical protein